MVAVRDSAEYKRTAILRRGALSFLTVATTLFTTLQLATVLIGDEIDTLDLVMLVLFALCFSWITFSFWTTLAGFVAMHLRRSASPGLCWPTDAETAKPLATETAIVMPIYNEDTAKVFANVQAIYESLEKTGHAGAFDFYILSDTTNPDIWVAEELAWHALCDRVQGHGRIFYRKRRFNTARKAGNIADFCRRWGGRYEHMIVLDADSLMDGRTLVTMARLMEVNPGVGLVQVPPMIVGRSTLFGRMVQFASRAYGPVFAAGQAFWQLGEGNYWGHNAIIRTQAFIDHCGLPELPGRAPLGGHILSHDFVEAALLRRAGWKVWLVPELTGSYEDCPPTLIDFAKRDQRWCQGNMQHARVVLARGFHWVSRLHLMNGIMSYVSSVLWLAFLAVGMATVIRSNLIDPVYFGPQKSLFPAWPTFNAQLAQSLFGVALVLLFVPRLLGIVNMLLDRRVKRTSGGAFRIVGSALLEMIYSTLLAPIMMLFQSSFVIKTFAGLNVGWNTQRRTENGMSWLDAVRQHFLHTLFGAAIAGVAWYFSPDLLAWLSPVVAGLLLSAPISYYTARVDLGVRLRRLGLFLIPEETVPPSVVRRARELEIALAPASQPVDAVARLEGDPLARAVHVLLVRATPEAAPPDPILPKAREKHAAHAPLTPPEKLALLWDVDSLTRLPATVV
ncbi:MAG: glucans biosynthesis glucosyltransferase MdoH [Alphaproteobacteria bacterium]